MLAERSSKFAFLILALMFAMMLLSSWGDSAIEDEKAHIPAGYSYLVFQDYRLNPEHPPLVKALAAVPLLFLHLNYPLAATSWTTDTNGQWDQGIKFLYESGNNPDAILFWARFPMILLTLLTGAAIWWWTQKYFGRRAALLTLLLFAFSPTFLAHGRFVATDIGATLGFLIGIAAFVSFLETPNWHNVIVAGAAFGIAELLKFSTILLIPLYGILVLGWALTRMELSWKAQARETLILIGKTLVIGATGVVIISLVYAAFMIHYPAERQIRDSDFLLSSFGFRPLVGLQHQLMLHALTRPFAHYFLGVLMVIQRSAGGNTSYFLGEVSAAGSRIYFPVVYFFKEPLAFHLLTLIALALGISRIAASRPWSGKRLGYWIENNFRLFAAWAFIIVYWGWSMKSPLNIGMRHVLPTFPFIYLLVSREIGQWIRGRAVAAPRNLRELFSSLYHRLISPLPRLVLVFCLFLWLIADTLFVYPHFLSYYNELAGGPRNGYRIAVDSNYDWGQDLRRLAEYVRQHNIDKINLDYFGGGSPRYYLDDRYVPWWSAKGPAHGYFAISATLREGAINPAAPGFVRKPEDSYEWLKTYQPIDQVGYSIFVYHLP